MSRRNTIARLVRMTPRIRSLSPYLSARKLGRVLHTLLPPILALSVTAAAHAQGTMDFSGATTLMTTFNMSMSAVEYQIMFPYPIKVIAEQPMRAVQG